MTSLSRTLTILALALGAVFCLVVLLYYAVVYRTRGAFDLDGPPALQGILPLDEDGDFVIHPGGFCFPGDQFSSARIMGSARLVLQGPDGLPLPADTKVMGQLQFAWYSDEPTRWPRARQFLNISEPAPADSSPPVPQDQMWSSAFRKKVIDATPPALYGWRELIEYASACQEVFLRPFSLMDVDLRPWEGQTSPDVPRHVAPKVEVSFAQKFKRGWNVLLIGHNVKSSIRPLRYALYASEYSDSWDGKDGQDAPLAGSCPVTATEYIREQVNRVVAPAGSDDSKKLTNDWSGPLCYLPAPWP